MSRYGEEPSFMRVLVLVSFLVIALPLILFRGSCVSDEVALRAAATSGYTNPKVVERRVFFVGWQGCSESDAVGFVVKATNVQGQEVTLLVCSGYFVKAATVRIP